MTEPVIMITAVSVTVTVTVISTVTVTVTVTVTCCLNKMKMTEEDVERLIEEAASREREMKRQMDAMSGQIKALAEVE